MARRNSKTIIELPFPQAGLDRSGSYRSSPPFTSPDLSNVRSFDPIERRNRGGSRPGLGKAFFEELGSGARVDLLNQVTTQATDSSGYQYYWSDLFNRDTLGSQWSTASWVGTAPPVSDELDGSYTYSQYVGAVSAALNYSTSSDYSIDLYILPYDGEHHGTYYIYARMDDTTPVGTTDGIVGALTLSGATGAYSGSLTSYASGTPTANAFSTGNTTTAKPGVFRITVSTNTVTCYWSGIQLWTGSVSAHSGKRVGFGLAAVSQYPDGMCLVDKFAVMGSPASGSSDKPSSKRTYLVAASGGSLYSEQTVGALSATSGDVDIASGHRISSDERGQSLYIADYDIPRLTGTDGTIAGDGVTLDAASVSDWTAHSIDADNDVVVITAGTGSVTNGTYKISSIAAGDLTLASTTGGAGTCTYRIGRAPKVFDPANDSLAIWTATTGEVPTGCRIVARWRDRVILAGDPNLPNVWHMSRLGDPLDFDTSQTDVLAAVDSTTADCGKVGDAITAVVPFSDGYVVFGCTNSIWILNGDPAAGGTQSALSYSCNILDQWSWCRGPHGELYFLGTDGLYVIAPGGASYPQPLSREILPQELTNLDPALYDISLAWDADDHGVRIMVCPYVNQATKHFFYDVDGKSFWKDSYSRTDEPIILHAYKTDRLGDPNLLWGCRDGYIRHADEKYESDDGTAITSYVQYSPVRLSGNDYDHAIVQEIDASLAADSDDVSWELYVGDTNEAAVDASSAFASGTWAGDGLQYKNRPNARAGSAVLKLSNGGNRPWSIERVVALVQITGRQRRL